MSLLIPSAHDAKALSAIRAHGLPLQSSQRHDALLRMIGDARFVLLGEASHGTQEFYQERAAITQRLLLEKGFHAVVIEGDWPDAYRVNRFVRGLGSDTDASAALSGFERFPRWMWRNRVVRDFLDWQRQFNAKRPAAEQGGFYGLDLYSLNASMAAVLEHLQASDPDSAQFVRERFACFDQFSHDSQIYGMMTGVHGLASCESAVDAVLAHMLQPLQVAPRVADAEAEFDAVQNAFLVQSAEAYYRSMYLRHVSSWNLRDQHMAESLGRLEHHLRLQLARQQRHEEPKIVVWAHNSHLGDARATEMSEQREETNLGQLMRERHGEDAFLLGFSTYSGTVRAASDWGEAAQRMAVRPALEGSHEALMHKSGLGDFLLPLHTPEGRPTLPAEPRLERAIGVIYRPETERWSHYFHARLPQQFDALIHIDITRALDALESQSGSLGEEAAETYPAAV